MARRRTDTQWLEEAWERARVVVIDVVGGGQFLVRDVPGLDGLTGQDAVELIVVDPTDAPKGDPFFLGVGGDGIPFFAVTGVLPEVSGTRVVNLRNVAHLLNDVEGDLAVTAVALAHWHARHPYSAETGRPTTVGEGGWVRADDGGTLSWPRTDPAVIVLVHDGAGGPDGRCLLGQNAAWTRDRRFSCLAGFVEPGESAEATVAREVSEEVGATVTDVRYAASQAWPFPGSLMLGFFAMADPDQALAPDPAEISEARWFTRREILAALAGQGDGFALSSPASIANYLITRWAREQV